VSESQFRAVLSSTSSTGSASHGERTLGNAGSRRTRQRHSDDATLYATGRAPSGYLALRIRRCVLIGMDTRESGRTSPVLAAGIRAEGTSRRVAGP